VLGSLFGDQLALPLRARNDQVTCVFVFCSYVGTPPPNIEGKFFVRQLSVLSNIQSRMSAFSKNLFELLGDSDNEAPAAAPAPAAKQPAQPAVKEQAARPKTEKSKRGGKSDGKA
jgi:hypothetical protein